VLVLVFQKALPAYGPQSLEEMDGRASTRWMETHLRERGRCSLQDRAWLGGGTTLTSFRNRGAQKALIQALLQEGAARGVSTFVVETEAPSADKANITNSNLAKMGFELICNRSNFIL
jgi:hypothetical protein